MKLTIESKREKQGDDRTYLEEVECVIKEHFDFAHDIKGVSISVNGKLPLIITIDDLKNIIKVFG